MDTVSWLRQSQEDSGTLPEVTEPPEEEEVVEIRTIDGDLFVETSALKDSMKGLFVSSYLTDSHFFDSLILVSSGDEAQRSKSS
jgi:hypothetical protein